MPKDNAVVNFADTTSLESPADDATYLDQLRAGLAEHRMAVPDFGGGSESSNTY